MHISTKQNGALLTVGHFPAKDAKEAMILSIDMRNSIACALAISSFAFPTGAGLAAGGPIGIGELKLGMTQSQVESLKGPVQLTSSLAKWEPAKPEDYTPALGELKLEGMMNNPVTQNSKATLTFTNGRLSSIFLTLDDESGLNTARHLIASKYGTPQIDNRQKDEQCIYRNGNSFTLKNGIASYKWIQPHGGGVVTTNIFEILINVCPSNLRYGTTGGIAVRSLSISYSSKAAKESNPF
jgi:hypothetical protein